MIRVLVVVALLGTGAPSTAPGQDIAPVRLIGDSVSVRLNDIELRSAVQMLGRYLDRPIIIGTMPSARVTLETPAPVAKGEVLRLLRGLLDMHNIERSHQEESNG